MESSLCSQRRISNFLEKECSLKLSLFLTTKSGDKYLFDDEGRIGIVERFIYINYCFYISYITYLNLNRK